MNEQQFGKKVRHLLNSGSLGTQVERRLLAAREAAIARQRPERVPALAWADNVLGRFGGWTTGGVVNMSAQDHMGLDLSAFRMLEVRSGDWKLVDPRN